MNFVFNYLRVLLGFIQCLSYAGALYITFDNLEAFSLGLGYGHELGKKTSVLAGTEMLFTGAFKYMFAILICLIFVIATGFIRDLIPKDDL